MYPIETAALTAAAGLSAALIPVILLVTQAAKWATGWSGTRARYLALACGAVTATIVYRAGLMPAGTTPGLALAWGLFATAGAALTYDETSSRLATISGWLARADGGPPGSGKGIGDGTSPTGGERPA